MSWRHLGETFDIHGGGTDLIFPHHENEIAQSLCAFPGSQFARYWVHNGMLLVNGEKMAKSLGNFTTLRDALRQVPGEVIRFLLIRTHYRSTPDFSDAAINEAKKELDRFYRALERCPDAGGGTVPDTVLNALCDDLNTPLAFSAMHALADAAFAGDAGAAADLRASGHLIGLLTQAPEAWFRGGTDDTGAIAGSNPGTSGRSQGPGLRTGRRDPGGSRRARDRPGGRSGRHDVAQGAITRRISNEEAFVCHGGRLRRSHDGKTRSGGRYSG